MTVQELYDYAKEKGILNYEIVVKYRDEGGEYPGVDDYIYLAENDDEKVLVL